jgi:hypothetical protein
MEPGSVALSGISSQKPCTSKHTLITQTRELVLILYSYFIGFSSCNAAKFPRSNIPTDIDITWVAEYGLAIPNSNAWLKEGWTGDTSEWKW